MRGLTSIGRPRFETIVHTNRDVEPLFVVPVEIAKGKTEGAIRVLVPPLERRGHTLARSPRDRHIPEGLRLRRRPRADGQSKCHRRNKDALTRCHLGQTDLGAHLKRHVLT